MDLNLLAVISLAVADSVNPCELAILFMILVSIMLYNPHQKSKVLVAGLMFTLSVFVMYIIYGAIIITLFTSLNENLKHLSEYIYKAFGFFAIVLGLLGIKDYFMYKPGTIGTEMPLFLRPRVKKLISKVTSVKGAFFTGIFVTLFLLPCTIGPYLIFGNLISQAFALSLSAKLAIITKSLPWLLLYNFIFVLPMIFITFLIYFGVTTVKEAQEWKDRKIRLMHLIAGIILFVLGLAILFGWIQ